MQSNDTLARRTDPVIRFWSKVDKNGPIPSSHPELGNCWPRAGANCRGYGIFNDGVKKSARATHFAWNLASETNRPEGSVIGHTCDNPPCVRNDTLGTYEVDGILYERRGHLWFAGDSPTNTRDRTIKGRTSRIGAPHAGQLGEANTFAKLTDVAVIAIRSLYANGVTQVDLAQRFNVGQSTISRVVLRKVWKHLP